jgi:hypothetical protein
MNELDIALAKRQTEKRLREQGRTRREARIEVARMQWPALEKGFVERLKERFSR